MSVASIASPLQRAGKAATPLALLVALAGGCRPADLGYVSGTVTVDGAPAKTGSIAFFPSDGRATTAGATIADGQYAAQVGPGTARVEIRVPKVVGQKKLYDSASSPVRPVMAESLPARFNDQSQLTLDVQRGENQKDWELTTK